MTQLLAGKVALITGAGRGIGAAAARLFAAEGASVVLAARSADGLDAVAGAVMSVGGRATTITADFGHHDQVDRVVEHAVATFGRLAAQIRAMRAAGTGGAIVNTGVVLPVDGGMSA